MLGLHSSINAGDLHHHSVPLLLIVTVLLSGASSAAAATDAGDAAAMWAIAKALDPTNVLGWSAYSDPYTTWDGIRCTDNRVTSILVSARGISGVLPSEVCNLVDLQVMTNNLSGPLPSLSSLSSLSTLFLANNSFSIPADFFSGLDLPTIPPPRLQPQLLSQFRQSHRYHPGLPRLRVPQFLPSGSRQQFPRRLDPVELRLLAAQVPLAQRPAGKPPVGPHRCHPEHDQPL